MKIVATILAYLEYLFEKEFRETSQNFYSFRLFKQFPFLKPSIVDLNSSN